MAMSGTWRQDWYGCTTILNWNAKKNLSKGTATLNFSLTCQSRVNQMAIQNELELSLYKHGTSEKIADKVIYEKKIWIVGGDSQTFTGSITIPYNINTLKIDPFIGGSFGSTGTGDYAKYTIHLDNLSNGHIKLSNIWKNAVAWIKINNIWKRCIIWKKINGIWKKGK